MTDLWCDAVSMHGCSRLGCTEKLGVADTRPGAIPNQRTNPNLISDSESRVVESDLESESCRFESESDSESSVRFRF